MKSFLMICCLSVGLAASAESSYLYWCVDQSGLGSDYWFDYATVKSADTGAYYDVFSGTESMGPVVFSLESTGYLSTREGEEGVFSGKIEDSVTALVFELWRDGGLYMTSDPILRSAWDNTHLFVGESIQPGSADGLAPLVVNFAPNVPEPASAVLLLFGCAALALRRRKVEAAVEG